MATEIATRSPFVPAERVVSFSDMQHMAETISKSKLFGSMDPTQALSLMLIAQAEGLHPAIAARDFDIIQGRPSKKSEAMLRSFLVSGGRVKWHELTDTKADATFTHPAGGEVRIDWDIKRAQIAGLGGKDMYKKFPRQMLRSRCISEGVRTVCPSATSGMYVPEEIEDMDNAPPAAEPEALMPQRRSAAVTHSAPAEESAPAQPAAPVDAPAAPVTSKAATAAPAAPTGEVKTLTTSMLVILRRKAAANNVPETELCAKFEVGELSQIPAARINEAMIAAGGAK